MLGKKTSNRGRNPLVWLAPQGVAITYHNFHKSDKTETRREIYRDELSQCRLKIKCKDLGPKDQNDGDGPAGKGLILLVLQEDVLGRRHVQTSPR